ncbi:MAG: hypothetical protein ACU836_14790 [Gammaproteobacteria bacterium]
MKKLVFLILCLPITLIQADEIVVINESPERASALSKDDVSNIFLGKGRNQHDFVPYDQQDLPLRKRFYHEVSGLSLASVRAYWARQVFTGRGHPPPLLTDEETELVLRHNPKAITYSFAQQKPEDAKVLFSTEEGEQK